MQLYHNIIPTNSLIMKQMKSDQFNYKQVKHTLTTEMGFLDI